LAPLGIASLALRLQTPLDQCCPYNAVFSTFACCAGFLQRVSMTGIICLLWVAFGLSAALLPGPHAHIHEQRNRPISSLASSGLEGCWRIPIKNRNRPVSFLVSSGLEGCWRIPQKKKRSYIALAIDPFLGPCYCLSIAY